MFIIAIVLIAIGALAGVSMAVLHFRGRTPPKPLLAALHGVFVISGVVVLFLAITKAGTGGLARTALGLFLLAALGGLTLLSFHMRGRALPNLLVVGHGFLAVVAFLTLLAAVFVMGS